MPAAALSYQAHFSPLLRQLLRQLLRNIVVADVAALQQTAQTARLLERACATSAPAQERMRLISTLSDALARGAVALACDEQRTALPCWCWIALGSAGR